MADSAFLRAIAYGEGYVAHERIQMLRLNTASLMYTRGKVFQATHLIERWVENSNREDINAYKLMSSIYLDERVARARDAVCPAYYAVKTLTQPDKNMLQMLVFAHFEVGDINGSSEVLQQMINYFPESFDNVFRLGMIYIKLNKYTEALQTMESLYNRQQFTKEIEYQTLVKLYTLEGFPSKAKTISQEATKKGFKVELKD